MNTKTKTRSLSFALLFALLLASPLMGEEAGLRLSGELKVWHPVTLLLNGPESDEEAVWPNPFTDYRLDVVFEHAASGKRYVVPGHFAADGKASASSATAGNVWRTYFTPSEIGRWTYQILFFHERDAVFARSPKPLEPYHGLSGEFQIEASDKSFPDFRARGRLIYTGERYLRFGGTGEPFFKAGPDSPETLLAFIDFDGAVAAHPTVGLKTWEPHIQDWQDGDPTWHNGRGKGLIGALNYLAAKGLNTLSFLTYNAAGDGDNVWPFTHRNNKLSYDVSKLDQWNIVFAHAQQLGLHLNFKLQETENDDERVTLQRVDSSVPEALDGGRTGKERMLYLREMVSRFGQHLVITWNLGEENTQTPEEISSMIRHLKNIDPYQHLRVLHTPPNLRNQMHVYDPLLGPNPGLTGVSLQNDWREVYKNTRHWIEESRAAGWQWVVANDEQGPSFFGVPPDPGYEGFGGTTASVTGEQGYTREPYDLHDVRKHVLWGNLMAGGAGVEYYFGYQLPQNDLNCEDFRSRDQSWNFCKVAIEFFRTSGLPWPKMLPANEELGLGKQSSARSLALTGQVYLLQLPEGGTLLLDLPEDGGTYSIQWLDPRAGGPLVDGSVSAVKAGKARAIGFPPSDRDADWVVLIKRK